MPYRIEYPPEAGEYLRFLSTRNQTIGLEKIEKQLVHQPTLETKNRKPMRPKPLVPWELRIDKFRVYYEMDETEPVVNIRAIGVKDRNLVVRFSITVATYRHCERSEAISL